MKNIYQLLAGFCLSLARKLHKEGNKTQAKEMDRYAIKFFRLRRTKLKENIENQVRFWKEELRKEKRIKRIIDKELGNL